MDELTAFMQDVKDGYVRGDSVQTMVAPNVCVELSVGPFQYGIIHIRVMVDDKQIEPSEGLYYRRLYNIDSKYADIHERIKKTVEAENETDVTNAHEWECKRPDEAQRYKWLPDELNPDSTVFFSGEVQLRNDVSVTEAMETNRPEENKPDKYTK